MEIKDCCRSNQTGRKDKSFFQGVLYGILPHSFCIAFVILSIIGATAVATIFRKFLLLPYFFEMLIGLSFVFATISAAIYLKKLEALSIEGIKRKVGYLGILYGTTVVVNLLLFFVIFPAAANTGRIRGTNQISLSGELKTVTLEVKIPCSGHASLITGELKGLNGVKDVRYQIPNIFSVSYDAKETDLVKIVALEIFKTYPAVIK